jgi:metal-sulfur cluster biosynthetic enzyme
MARARAVLLRLLVTALVVAAGVAVMSLPRLLRPHSSGPASLDPFAPMAGTGKVPADSLPADSARVFAALRPVQDPEIDLSIIDLGLVESLKVDSSANVRLTLIPTVPECPFARVISLRALRAIESVPGVESIRVAIDPAIAWDPSRLAPGARDRFRETFGIEPADRR